MKRVLFLTKNIRDQRYGLLCLAAYLKKKGHSVAYVRASADEDCDEVVKKIETYKPDYLAVTAMSGEIKYLLCVLAEVKNRYKHLFVVLGGPHATFSPEIIESSLIDAVCRGEGEEAFAEFLEKHPHGDYQSVRNFSFKNKGDVIHNPLRPLIDINSLPFPDFDFVPRQVSEKIVLFLSRNCIFSCAYCFNEQYRQMYKESGCSSTYSHFSVTRALEQLEFLKNKYAGQFKYFYFQDDIFPTDGIWLKEFSKQYAQKICIPFHVGLNPALIKDTTITFLKDAGCFSVNLAIESGSLRVRTIMNRPKLDNSDLIRACKIVKKNRIYIITQNITMSPTETIEDAKQTLELNIACKVDNASVGKFQPYPGTRMTQFAIDKGLVTSEEILNKLPENYHWESLLTFDKKEALQMDNLLHLFSLTIKYPFLKFVVYRIIHYKWDRFFHHIDNQYWMTHTHRSFDSIYKRNLLRNFYFHVLFIKRLIFPIKKSNFVY